MVCIIIGIGIGGGIIVGWELYCGVYFYVGEFGVMLVGNNGESMYKIVLISGLMVLCCQVLVLFVEEMLFVDVIFEWMVIDVYLCEVVNDWVCYFLCGVYSVIFMFDLGVVLIGGGISE